MSESAPTLTIREAIAIALYKIRYTNRYDMYRNFNKLSTWLDTYKWIPTSEQTLIEGALHIPPYDKEDLLNQYQFCNLLSNYFTEQEQINICRHIKCYPHRFKRPQPQRPRYHF